MFLKVDEAHNQAGIHSRWFQTPLLVVGPISSSNVDLASWLDGKSTGSTRRREQDLRSEKGDFSNGRNSVVRYQDSGSRSLNDGTEGWRMAFIYKVYAGISPC